MGRFLIILLTTRNKDKVKCLPQQIYSWENIALFILLENAQQNFHHESLKAFPGRKLKNDWLTLL